MVATSLHGSYEPDSLAAKLVRQSTGVPECGQRGRIFPFKWFYGGKELADNPFLKESHGSTMPQSVFKRRLQTLESFPSRVLQLHF